MNERPTNQIPGDKFLKSLVTSALDFESFSFSESYADHKDLVIISQQADQCLAMLLKNSLGFSKLILSSVDIAIFGGWDLNKRKHADIEFRILEFAVSVMEGYRLKRESDELLPSLEQDPLLLEAVKVFERSFMTLINLLVARHWLNQIDEETELNYYYLAKASGYVITAVSGAYESSVIIQHKVSTRNMMEDMGRQGGSRTPAKLEKYRVIADRMISDYFLVENSEKTQTKCVEQIWNRFEMEFGQVEVKRSTLVTWVRKERPDWASHPGRKPKNRILISHLSD